MTTIAGSSGPDSLGPGPTSPFGADGGTNDSILGQGGNDSISGGGGNDTLFGGNDDDSIFGGTGADTLSGDDGNDSLFGGDGSDSLSGGNGSDVLDGGAGADTLVGGSGTDTVRYVGSSAAVSVSVNGTGAGGDAQGDVLSAVEALIGSAFNDTLTGDSLANRLQGGGGDDYIYGRAGTDSLYGGAGLDVIFAGADADTLEGGDDADRLYGEAGADWILGDAGNDRLFGGDADDSLFGGDGNDTLEGGFGNDSLIGGAGADAASYGNAALAVTVDLAAGLASGDAGTDTLTSIEDAIGGFGSDSITGDGGDNRLWGGAGNDTLFGGGGNDTIEGGLGDDSLQGGDGIDELSFRGAAAGVNASLAAGTSGGEGNDTFTGFENLHGSGHSDTLTGDGGANRITGGDGNDLISAAGGNDSVFGEAGNDTVDGGDGNDLIFGGADSGTTGSGAPVSLDFNWTALPVGTSLVGGVSQDTGGINVAIEYQGGPTATVGRVSDLEIYRAPGETFNVNSSAEITKNSVQGEPSQVNITFAALSGSNFDDEVRNVQFRFADIDGAGSWRDRITVIAYDAAGNRVPVSFTLATDFTVIQASGDTLVGLDRSLANEPKGSALIKIAGPVARIEIQYDDPLRSGAQGIYISDIQFQAIPVVDNDSLSGGAGDDSIFGGIGEDTLDGGIGEDMLEGGLGNDSLIGGAGDDSIFGGIGEDTLDGGIDDDTLEGGLGNDSLIGGAGTDVAFYGNAAGAVTVDLAAGLASGSAGNDTLTSIEDVIGSFASDSITGDGGANRLWGGAGNDTLNGGLGEDSIFGGTGADLLYGGDGNDLFGYAVGDVDSLSSVLSGVESVFGGGGPGAGPDDFDTIDVSAYGSLYGWASVVIVRGSEDPDDPHFENGTISLYDRDPSLSGAQLVGTIVFDNIEDFVICFTPGTLILTERGEVAVETIVPGDMVKTRDNGLQPLRWVGHRHLSRRQLLADPDLQPVRIAKDALRGEGPARSMMVSPQHRVLVTGARAELLFGTDEVLVPAKHLVGEVEAARVLPQDGVTYIHLLFDRHEIVQSDGIWTESFQPAERSLNAMEAAVRDEILKLFPELALDGDGFVGARLSLKAHEARVLLAG